jgi:ribosomal protein S27AE
MDNLEQLEGAFDEVLASTVVSTRCGTCGAETIMNNAYKAFAKGPLLTCGKCRNQRSTQP